jgi:hypothetical protein
MEKGHAQCHISSYERGNVHEHILIFPQISIRGWITSNKVGKWWTYIYKGSARTRSWLSQGSIPICTQRLIKSYSTCQDGLWPANNWRQHFPNISLQPYCYTNVLCHKELQSNEYTIAILLWHMHLKVCNYQIHSCKLTHFYFHQKMATFRNILVNHCQRSLCFLWFSRSALWSGNVWLVCGRNGCAPFLSHHTSNRWWNCLSPVPKTLT